MLDRSREAAAAVSLNLIAVSNLCVDAVNISVIRLNEMQYSILTLLAFTSLCALCAMCWNSFRPPSMADWNYTVPPNGNPIGDEGYAYEHFCGKSKDEALVLLRENDEYYVEDFSYMPKAAFNFYYPALVKHITSAPLHERNVIGYLGLISLEIEFDSDQLEMHAQLTVDTLRFIETNAVEYDELEGPLGLFETRLEKCIHSDWFSEHV